MILERYCPLFLKGEDNPASKNFERSPGIFINQKTGTVYVYVSKKNNAEGQHARTLGYIKPNKWSQITVIFTESAIKIYIKIQSCVDPQNPSNPCSNSYLANEV